jgi:hypothetical protein
MRIGALACGLFFLGLLLSYSSFAVTSDPGPADIVLKSSDSSKKPPSVFPHLKHQESITCGECHHAMVDGKKAPYTEGMAIEKCESCHNSETLGGKKEGKYELDTFKGAAHGNCLECHKKIAKEDSSQKKLKSCKTCHVK